MTRIREYQDADRSQVTDLWHQIFPGSTGHNDPEAAIDRKTAHSDGLFFVAVDNDVVIGTIMGGYDGHRGWIYSVAVSPNAQRRGIGTALMKHVERALADRGCPKVNLQVRADNEAVVAFYESLGYLVEERVSLGKLIEPN